MWTEFLHHLFLQVPIIASIGLTILGIYFVRSPADNLSELLRILSWMALVGISGAAITGILSAPGLLGGGGPEELSHHRNLGLIVWVITLFATIGFEIGVHNKTKYAHYIKSASILLWAAVAFVAIGAGHWGGAYVHSDKIPWDLSSPAIEKVK